MKLHLNKIKSRISLFVCRIFYGKSFSCTGVPIQVRFSSFQMTKGGSVRLGRMVNIEENAVLKVRKGAKLELGDDVYFNRNCIVVCRGCVVIGSHCRFGPNVCIYDHDHSYDGKGVNDEFRVGEIQIGEKCWIGANSVILRDSRIGDGCIVGAGVVIKGDIPAHSLVFQDKAGFVIREIH